MHGSESAEVVGDEKRDIAPTWYHQNTVGIDIKIKSSNSADLYQRNNSPRRKARRKDDGPQAILCDWVVEHQIGLSMNLLILLGLTHLCFPKARMYTRKFFELSYYNPKTGDYALGRDDACKVFYWIVLFTGLRASVMDFILTPLAKWLGIEKAKDRTRFAEQAWLLIYYTVFWPVGMYILYNSAYWLNIKAVWADWPDREIGGLLKWYILAQSAFWLQQIMVINIEKRRKDHWQMFTHHIITCILLFASYAYHQTKVANLILCLMDAVDLFLPMAKCLKYMGFSTLCDIVFGLFMITWFIARHVLYLMVCKSVWKDIPIEIAYGCYKGKKGSLAGPFPPPDSFGHFIDPFRNPEGVVCFNHEIKWAFLGCLLFLQCLTLVWFCMICRVAAKVLSGGQAEDTRSDDEDEDDYEENEPPIFRKLDPIEIAPLEEEVGVEAINLRARTAASKRYKKTSSSSSGVMIPGHSDRKELLGRIGCDKSS